MLLYSRATDVTTIFTFESTLASPVRAISTSDPVLLRIPAKTGHMLNPNAGSRDSQRRLRTIGLVLNNIHHDMRQLHWPSKLAQDIKACNAKFYQLTLLRDDGSLLQCLYIGATANQIASIPPPDIRNPEAMSQALVRSSDSFVIPHTTENTSEHYQPEMYCEQDLLHAAKVSSPQQQLPSQIIIVSWLAREIDQVSSEEPEMRSFTEVLDCIHEAIEGRLTKNELSMDILYVTM